MKIKLLKLDDKLDFGKYNGKPISEILTDVKYLKYMLSRNKNIKLHKEVIVEVQKNVSLNFGAHFINVLKMVDSKFSRKLLRLNDKVLSSSMVDIKLIASKNDMIKFRDPVKGGKYNEVKLGRFISKLFTDNKIKLVNSELEEFINDYKAYHGSRRTNYVMELVKGEDIRKYYKYDKYFSRGGNRYGVSGSLGGSCMRHEGCQPFFDIYCKNPKQVSMLIMKDKATGLIKGRAIVWIDMEMTMGGTDKSEKVIFMDRIYSTSYQLANVFKMHAKKEGWVLKTKQGYQNQTHFQRGDTKFHATMKCKLQNADFQYYPYVDTIKNICKEEKIVSNTYVSRTNRTYSMRSTGGYL